ncbi:hypothetical protein IPF37_01710 [bacterium]|nr:MAG: hypothetical protein IPF37_01710 [bacterium]
MKLLRRAYVLLAVLFCLVSQVALHATGLSPRAFKNVNQCFKPGYEYYSPIFGSTALSCGIIENLRFYNVEAAHDADGKRVYIKDKVPANDPVLEIIKILFPSPAGQLTTETGYSANFGKYCTVAHVAALLNFSYAVRKWLETNENLPSEIDNILSITNQKVVVADAFPKNKFLKKNSETPLYDLLLNIAKVIKAEVSLKVSNGSVFYPYYFVEQIITAFFCHKFADQNDIKALLSGLNENIVDKSKIDQINGLLEKEDIMPALERIDQGSLDDLWIIANRDVFTRAIPYKNGTTPISNGNAQMYQRSTNTFSNTTFADCVETTVRHIINFMFYNRELMMFNMASLDAHMNGKNAAYIPNLQAFYAVQPPDKANAGSQIIRSTWNKVVADLGHDVVYCQKFVAADAENNNELDTGMLNFVRVFKTIFSLEAAAEPVLVAGQEEAFKESVQTLVTDCLQKFCTVLNAEHSCDVDYADVSIDSLRNDLLGNIEVVVNSGPEQLFGFTVRVLVGHIDIQNLQISQKDSIGLKDEDIQKARTTLLADQEKTINPSMLLLDAALTKDLSAISVIYQLFNESISDTNSIVKALNNVHDMFEKKAISVDRAVLILKNLLHSFLWEDKASVQQIMTTLIKLKEESFFEETIKAEVKSLVLKNDNDFVLLLFFQHVSTLFLDQESTIKVLDLSMCPQLKRINAFEDKQLESIKCSAIMEFLEEVDLSFAKIKSIEFMKCPQLKKIHLMRTENLEFVKFSEIMERLVELNLMSSGIKKIDLSRCPQLDFINFRDAQKLEVIKFSDRMDSLQKIDMSRTRITAIEFPLCPQLKTVNLRLNQRLESIKFSDKMDSLQEIEMFATGIKTIEFSLCPKLKKIDLAHTDKLEVVKFNETMESLEEIILEGSRVNTIKLSACPVLTKINLKNTRNLESITFSGVLENLKEISFDLSAPLKEISLPACPIMQNINFSLDMAFIEFTGPMPQLKRINFFRSLKKIKGLKFCPELDKQGIPVEKIID